MSRIVAVGAAARVAGFAIAGVTVMDTDRDGVDAVWDRLPEDAGLVVLTADAARALGDRLAERPRVLWTVMPT